jgi:hypothetical protein
MIKLARSVILPLALVAAVAACDKGKSGGGGASGPTGVAGASAIAPAKGGLQRALAAMPADSEIILGVDFTKLRSSALFKKYEPMLMAQIGDDLKKFQDTCGFNPMDKLTGVVLGGKGREMANGTIFIRGFDKASAVDCLKKREAQEKAAGKPAVLTVDGDYVEYTEEADPAEAMRVLWVDDQTALLIKDGEQSAGKDALLAAAAAKDGEGLTSSKAFTDLLAKTHTGSALWFVAKGDSPMVGMAQMVKFKAIYGSVDVGSGINGEFRMWMNGADEAKSTAGDLGKQLDQVKSSPFGGMLSDVSVSADGEDVVTRIKLSQDQLQQIIKLAGQFGGGGGF